eukprot:gene4209-8380_t
MEETRRLSKAEMDQSGVEYLVDEPWQKMGTETFLEKASSYVGKLSVKVTGDLKGEDAVRVIWLSTTLFFTVGGYWLLRSIKDPIISIIDGVDRIPQAKIASLVVVFALVIVYNKLIDIFPKHQLFYMMGTAYGSLFFIIALLLSHPTIGLQNNQEDPWRLLGWISYVSIESFGSMVIQCYWALVNASVDTKFAKKYFGIIVAGAQIGSILGPTIATQAVYTGIPALYMGGSLSMFLMVIAMYLYMQRFKPSIDEKEDVLEGKNSNTSKEGKSDKEGGVLEGFKLFMKFDYVKGLFAVSCLFNVQVTVMDYMMKVLAKERFDNLYPDDPQTSLEAFASFMGHFGQVTNSISFLFSLFGTGFIIKYLGLTHTLLCFPILLLFCTVAVWMSPTLWVTSTTIKFKCKSWIETFGQRGSKAAGSIITNAFANSLLELAQYGSIVGVFISVFLVGVSEYMGRKFEELSSSERKIGEEQLNVYDIIHTTTFPASTTEDQDGFPDVDTSCAEELEEEGKEVEGKDGRGKQFILPIEEEEKKDYLL